MPTTIYHCTYASWCKLCTHLHAYARVLHVDPADTTAPQYVSGNIQRVEERQGLGESVFVQPGMLRSGKPRLVGLSKRQRDKVLAIAGLLPQTTPCCSAVTPKPRAADMD